VLSFCGTLDYCTIGRSNFLLLMLERFFFNVITRGVVDVLM
jgi:hypothetical protein